jgi:flagellar motility protein MotE (MotC chaperone)
MAKENEGNEGRKKTSFFSKILAFILFLVLLGVLSAFILLMDYIGAINLRKKIPDNIRQIPIVADYIEKVRVMHLSEEERLKYWIEEQNDQYNEHQQELKKTELDLETKMKELIDLEKQMESKKEEWNETTKKLDELKNNIEELEKRKTNINEGIRTEQLNDLEKLEKLRKIAVIYEKMAPDAAALTFNEMDTDLAIELIMMMKESKSALILNNMNAEKVTEITEKLKTKGAWKDNE